MITKPEVLIDRHFLRILIIQMSKLENSSAGYVAV